MISNYWCIDSNSKPTDLVIVPSVPILAGDMERFPGIEHYEERHLFTLLLLQKSNARVFFVSSLALNPAIVNYYLNLLPASHKSTLGFSTPHNKITLPQQNNAENINVLAGGRLFNLFLDNTDEICLGDKCARNPELTKKISKLLHKDANSYFLCYRTSRVEEEMAKNLDVHLYGSPSDLDHWGSKSGSRTIFAEAGIPFGMGTPLTYDVDELARGILDMIERKNKSNCPMNKVVVKLDEGCGGGGNSLMDLRPILKQGETPTLADVYTCLAKMQFPFIKDTWESWQLLIQRYGAIAECWFEGDDIRAPSVQGVVSKSGDWDLISTHEQLLDGQTYIGCTFPADTGYRSLLCEYGAKVAAVLAKKGIVGHFGVDFVVFRQSNGDWSVHAIEINLRYTGTTHPTMTMRLLIPGAFDLASGLYRAKNGQSKHYYETDHLQVNGFKGKSPEQLIDIINDTQVLRFDHISQTGPVFHLLSAAKDYGQIGVTCIANSSNEAASMLRLVERTFASHLKLF